MCISSNIATKATTQKLWCTVELASQAANNTGIGHKGWELSRGGGESKAASTMANLGYIDSKYAYEGRGKSEALR